MQAMSLTIDEGESEQNELRNLQEKLESTTSLVHTLSQQLVELKEQVTLLCLCLCVFIIITILFVTNNTHPAL